MCDNLKGSYNLKMVSAIFFFSMHQISAQHSGDIYIVDILCQVLMTSNFSL